MLATTIAIVAPLRPLGDPRTCGRLSTFHTPVVEHKRVYTSQTRRLGLVT